MKSPLSVPCRIIFAIVLLCKFKKFFCGIFSSERIVRKLRGHQLDIEYIEKHGFGYPILIRDAAGLDLKVPPSDFTVTDVELAVGK